MPYAFSALSRREFLYLMGTAAAGAAVGATAELSSTGSAGATELHPPATRASAASHDHDRRCPTRPLMATMFGMLGGERR